jgi:hypothetical protein
METGGHQLPDHDFVNPMGTLLDSGERFAVCFLRSCQLGFQFSPGLSVDVVPFGGLVSQWAAADMDRDDFITLAKRSCVEAFAGPSHRCFPLQNCECGAISVMKGQLGDTWILVLSLTSP